MTPPMLLALALATAGQQPKEAAPTRLSLEPRAEPVPALKYQLLPELRDKKSGNAALLYYRAFSPEWQGHRRDPKSLVKMAELTARPLRDLRAEDFKPFTDTLRSRMLQEVDRGARRAYCDWELLDRAREEGIGLLLPDLQTFRDFGTMLQLRARQELLDGQFDKAARTLQTGLAMSRHLTEGPTLIHALVAAADATMLLQAAEDWIERPGSPNLYWALTDLPRPLISLRTGFEAERLLSIDNLFPGYREMLYDPKAQPTRARVLTTMEQYARMLELEGGPAWGGSVLYAMRTYPAAKHFLIERGRSAEEVEKMPALQAVFLYEVYHFDVGYDDLRKWLNLPYPEAAAHMSRAAQRAKAESLEKGRARLASLLLPALDKIIGVSARVDRRVAALRVIEALRLYAAAHGGKLPGTLDEVKEVPIPLDPWTGRPFEYRREGDKATLVGPVGPGHHPREAIRYELTMGSAKEKN